MKSRKNGRVGETHNRRHILIYYQTFASRSFSVFIQTLHEFILMHHFMHCIQSHTFTVTFSIFSRVGFRIFEFRGINEAWSWLKVLFTYMPNLFTLGFSKKKIVISCCSLFHIEVKRFFFTFYFFGWKFTLQFNSQLWWIH